MQVSTEIEAEDEGSAVAAGRKRVEAHFPPSRYTVQNPRSSPPANAQRLLRAGAAQFLAKNYER